MTLIERAVSVRNDHVRIGALALLFIPHMVEYVLCSLLPVAWGGHPDKRRLLTFDFYDVPLRVFLAGMRGEFLKGIRR